MVDGYFAAQLADEKRERFISEAARERVGLVALRRRRARSNARYRSPWWRRLKLARASV